MKTRHLLASVGLLAATIAVALLGGSSAAAPRGRAAFDRIAHVMREQHPHGVVESSRTSRSSALKHIDGHASVRSSESVVTVSGRGNFRGEMLPRPAGTRAPSGHRLTVTVDDKTGQVLDIVLRK